MKKEKVDTEKLNEAITIGNKILKLTYALIIIALMGGTIFLLRTFKYISNYWYVIRCY